MIDHINGELKSQINETRLPSLNALRCFDAAARLESFSNAAEALHVTHGAISRAIRMLEQELGIDLFERRSRRVFLTDAGRELAVAIRESFAIIEGSIHQLKISKQKAPLVLSCEPTLMMRWLIPRLPQFQAAHPEVVIRLVAGGGQVKFGDGIDLAIRRNDFILPPDVHVHPLFE